MVTFLVILMSVLFVVLLLVAGMRPMPNILSSYELERRVKKANREAKVALRREQLLPDVLALQQVLVALLLVAVVLLSVVTFGWVIGVIVGVVVVLEYGAVTRIGAIRKGAGKLYASLEPGLLTFVERSQPFFAFIRSSPIHKVDDYRRFDSREELQRLVDQSGDALTDDERKLIVNGLAFKEQRVDSIMTPKSMIDSIKKSEFLGPLVLSELHNLGHSRLPVIAGDIDHVVGVLHLKDLLSLDVKRSVTVEKAMEPKVYYIRQDQTLEHALAAFLKTHHHLFIVINEQRETVGLLTLEDVVEALIGRKIFDEDDNHEDLRSIAAHKAEENNSPEKHTDV